MASQGKPGSHPYLMLKSKEETDNENNNLQPDNILSPGNGTISVVEEYVDPVEVARKNAVSRKIAIAIQAALDVEQQLGFMPVDELMKIVKPGDMVEFNRRIFSHFALYVGHGLVMNICAESLDQDSTYIRHEYLKTTSKGDSCRISNPDEVAWKHFHARPRPSDEIVATAKKYSATFQPYELTFRNCEFYCTMWRYGVGFGCQTSMLEINPANYILQDSSFKDYFFGTVFPLSRYHAINKKMQEKKSDEHIIHTGLEVMLSGTVIMEKYEETVDELVAVQEKVIQTVEENVNMLSEITLPIILPIQNFFLIFKEMYDSILFTFTE